MNKREVNKVVKEIEKNVLNGITDIYDMTIEGVELCDEDFVSIEDYKSKITKKDLKDSDIETRGLEYIINRKVWFYLDDRTITVYVNCFLSYKDGNSIDDVLLMKYKIEG